jgi:hypothetical protein
MADVDTLLARLERLEGENSALRARLEVLEAPSAADPLPADPPVSRRDLLRRAGTTVAAVGVGLLGASMATLSQASPALANGEVITVGGRFSDATETTVIQNATNDNDVFVATAHGQGGAIRGYTTGSGIGVWGHSDNGIGVQAESDTGPGLTAHSFGAEGIRTESQFGLALYGLSRNGSAIVGESWTSGIGVEGESDTGMGVYGASNHDAGVLGASGLQPVPSTALRASTGVVGIGGRGGAFIGTAAQVRLVPSAAATHPARGARGDLFLDKPGRLWFCKGGTTWKQLA